MVVLKINSTLSVRQLPLNTKTHNTPNHQQQRRPGDVFYRPIVTLVQNIKLTGRNSVICHVGTIITVVFFENNDYHCLHN